MKCGSLATKCEKKAYKSELQGPFKCYGCCQHICKVATDIAHFDVIVDGTICCTFYTITMVTNAPISLATKILHAKAMHQCP